MDPLFNLGYNIGYNIGLALVPFAKIYKAIKRKIRKEEKENDR